MPEGWMSQTTVITFSFTVIGLWLQIILK